MTYPQIAAILIALVTFTALAAGRIPKYPVNRAAMALIGAGLVQVLRMVPLVSNLTLIGSVANLIVAEQALKFSIKLSFTEYMRAGIIVTVLSLLVCIAWLQYVV